MPILMLHPRRDALAEDGAEIGVGGGDVGLLGGVGGQVVEDLAGEVGVVDVFPVGLAQGQEAVAVGGEEVGAVGVGGVEEAAALPAIGRGELEEVGDGGVEVDVAAELGGAAES